MCAVSDGSYHSGEESEEEEGEEQTLAVDAMKVNGKTKVQLHLTQEEIDRIEHYGMDDTSSDEDNYSKGR